MNKQKVIQYFGTPKKTAEKLGITSQAVYLWPDPIPEAQAWRAQHESGGELKFDWRDDYLNKHVRSGPQKAAA